MAVNAIQNNKDKTPKMSYIGSIIAGSAVGYSLKHLLPIASPEKKDESYILTLKEIRLEAKKDKANIIETIRNSEKKTLAEDTFIKMYDNNDLKISKIKKLEEPNKKALINLISKINIQVKDTFNQSKKAHDAVIKNIRPTVPFVATGAVVALATAFTYNVINILAAEKIERQYQEN